MTNEEFSNGFDTLVNSYVRFKDFDNKENLDSIEFDEYEKSLYLTRAQEQLVVNYYNGRNSSGDSFESTEESRRYLDTLVDTKVFGLEEKGEGLGVSPKSVFFQLPTDLAFITMEQIVYDDESLGCANGSRADVYPVTQDEYNNIKDNPFRGPTKYKAVRLDAGNGKVELVSKFNIGQYIVRYLKKPQPIVLVNLPEDVSVNGINVKTECELNSLLHNTILEEAVRMALISKGLGVQK